MQIMHAMHAGNNPVCARTRTQSCSERLLLLMLLVLLLVLLVLLPKQADKLPLGHASIPNVFRCGPKLAHLP